MASLLTQVQYVHTSTPVQYSTTEPSNTSMKNRENLPTIIRNELYLPPREIYNNNYVLRYLGAILLSKISSANFLVIDGFRPYTFIMT